MSRRISISAGSIRRTASRMAVVGSFGRDMVWFDLRFVGFDAGIGEWREEANAGPALSDSGRPDRVIIRPDASEPEIVSVGDTGARQWPKRVSRGDDGRQERRRTRWRDGLLTLKGSATVLSEAPLRNCG